MESFRLEMYRGHFFTLCCLLAGVSLG